MNRKKIADEFRYLAMLARRQHRNFPIKILSHTQLLLLWWMCIMKTLCPGAGTHGLSCPARCRATTVARCVWWGLLTVGCLPAYRAVNNKSFTFTQQHTISELTKIYRRKSELLFIHFSQNFPPKSPPAARRVRLSLCHHSTRPVYASLMFRHLFEHKLGR